MISVIVGLKLLIGKDSWRLGSIFPAIPARAVIGWCIGLVSTLMGIGGGVLNNTFMTLYGRPMHQAVGTSAGVGVLISIPAFLGYIWAGWGKAGLPPFSSGYVNWLTVLLIIPLTLIVTPLGVRLAHAMSRKALGNQFWNLHADRRRTVLLEPCLRSVLQDHLVLLHGIGRQARQKTHAQQALVELALFGHHGADIAARYVADPHLVQRHFRGKGHAVGGGDRRR